MVPNEFDIFGRVQSSRCILLLCYLDFFLASNQRFSSGFWVRAFFFQKSIVLSTLASSLKHKYQNLLETLPICQKMVPDVTEKEENPLSNIFTIFSSSSTALYYFMAYNLLWKSFFGKYIQEKRK